ncbi:MAG: tRNA preQ1(34) S-adenosylmethionine ribosyltransferase-isomerase QueA [Gallionellaceae bacterium]|nr:tRNA preQ1(34) S-adenosylmethionine ribosyltransferase-isomerase QueA [Gallionellaceae bacterium]
MRTDEFDFALPEHLIAQSPPERRGASRLLHVRSEGREDRRFADLPDLVQEHDVLVFNDTRVMKARLFGVKESGGRIEVLIERLLDERHALAQIRASHAPQPGGRLLLAGCLPVTVMGREGEFYRLRFDGTEAGSEKTGGIAATAAHNRKNVLALLEEYGQLPLPPYITHAASADDEERYQTVFARQPGAVAAPTAGLHFDAGILLALRARGAQLAYVTLHVGAGTFQPVRTENIHEHAMHSERYTIPQATVDTMRRARERGGRVIAVGTTSLRALESAAQVSPEQDGPQAGEGETRIFITPGYRFKTVDALLTNFHLPRSTLLMLACAFGGMGEILDAYRHAVKQEYRFFSYGDAMLIERNETSISRLATE